MFSLSFIFCLPLCTFVNTLINRLEQVKSGCRRLIVFQGSSPSSYSFSPDFVSPSALSRYFRTSCQPFVPQRTVQWNQLLLPPRESDFIDFCQWHHLAGTWLITETEQLGGVTCLSLQSKSENYPFLFPHLIEEMLPRGSNMSLIAHLVPLFNFWHLGERLGESSNILHPISDTESILEPQGGHSWEPCSLLETDLYLPVFQCFLNFSGNRNFVFLHLFYYCL